MSFDYDDSELPEITEDRSYELGAASHYSGLTVTYFNVGNWNMSSLDDEDADVEHAREAALAWIAWYNFLKENPDKITQTSKNNKGETNG